MTKEETLQILAMLSAYYGEGKSDVKTMVKAWHLIIGEFDYIIAERAIVEFAKNDTRDYASFPTPGAIVKAIKKQKGIYSLIFNTIYHNGSYRELPEVAQRIISEDGFEQMKAKDKTQLLNEREKIIETFIKRDNDKGLLTAKGDC